MTHLAIRHSEGAPVDRMTAVGDNDILLDMWVLGMFIRKGDCTISVAAELPYGRCLFALSLTQYVEGGLHH